MHGDGRVFIRTLEKDWGLMRMESGSSVRFILDFHSKSLKIVLARTIRGKAKETIAEVPGLFGGRRSRSALAARASASPSAK